MLINEKKNSSKCTKQKIASFLIKKMIWFIMRQKFGRKLYTGTVPLVRGQKHTSMKNKLHT